MTDCAWRSASVLLAVTDYSLSHTAARIDATSRGVRIASVPELDEETFAPALPIDYSALARSAGAIAEALTRARYCCLASSAGTELVLDVEGRVAVADDGNLQQSGAFGNLPAGEAYIAPIATFGNGTIVIDGPLTGYGVLARPLRVQLEAGSLVSAQGEASDWLLRRWMQAARMAA